MTVLETRLDGPLDVAVVLAGVMLLAALCLTVFRLLRGCTLPDRVVALDLISALLVAFLVLFALAVGVTAYMDAAIALALIAFLGTVAFARFAERDRPDGGRPVDDSRNDTGDGP
ncbi:monovalent cation/H+ antiporter complex subunit F [Roseospira goensis]|uniref:Multicomponent Na+:H+ antiporter subunit F n=1 Tax=Roseospira goensis TaxID=391922 RepID=A0A7W6WJE4_9PROT|nr:monovalent cation/H+ antiporter complex subunit F [Roseospira goensis]MBB4285091.1 multicomponent Na+:H+ antiporter subunit F [Roseospira goensis]